MAPTEDTARTASCQQDTIKLRKMGEELDAAAEYIEELTAQAEHSNCSTVDAAEHEALLERVGVLAKEVENLGNNLAAARDAQQKSANALSTARNDLVKANDTIVLLDRELEDQKSAASTVQAAPSLDPAERLDRAALLEVVYQLSNDNPGMSLEDGLVYISGAFAGEDDAPVLSPIPLAPTQEDSFDEGDMGEDPFVDDPEPLPQHEEPFAVWAPPADGEPSAEGDFVDFKSVSAPVPKQTSPLTSIEQLPDPIPSPVSASTLVPKPRPPKGKAKAKAKKSNTKSVPDGPNDTDWDPSAFTPATDQDAELQRLLDQMEDSPTETYGIKAFALSNPELFEKEN